jgi:hypothetical protein
LTLSKSRTVLGSMFLLSSVSIFLTMLAGSASSIGTVQVKDQNQGLLIFRTSGETTQNQYCPDKITTLMNVECEGLALVYMWFPLTYPWLLATIWYKGKRVRSYVTHVSPWPGAGRGGGGVLAHTSMLLG